MRKRIRLLSFKGGVGKSVLALQIAKYLKESEVPFLIEELDPLETICVLTSCDPEYRVIKYFSINDYLYKKLDLDEKKILKQYDKDWHIVVSDMFTGIKSESPIIRFQNKITDWNLNVFLTDKFTVKETIEYSREFPGYKVLIINFSEKNVEEELIEYVYEEGLFVKILSIPYFNSYSEFQNSLIVRNVIKELLDILVKL